MKKILSIFLILVIISLSMISCTDKIEFRDDLTASAVTAEIGKNVANFTALTEVPADYVSGTMKLPVESCESVSVYYPTSGSTFDEFGVLRAKDEASIAAITTALEAYIARRASDEFALDYIPEDAPKVKNAEIKTYGLYVTYFMLSDSEKTAASDSVKAALTK